MGLFNKKKTDEPKPAVADMPSLFMNDDSEGDHGKEAMLDFQLSYLLRIANTYEDGSELAKRVLMKMIGETPKIDSYGWVENLNLKSVKVWKQWQRIDLIAEVEADCGSGMKHHVIVVENKAYTGIHDDQLSRYAETIEDYYKDKDVQMHYWVITFFDSDTENYEAIANQCQEAKGRWKCTSFEDLIDLTEEERQKGTYNQIIDEFWIKNWY
jgi:hypothetical protein